MAIAGIVLLLGIASAIKLDPALPVTGPDLPFYGDGFIVERLPMSGNPRPLSALKVTDHIVQLQRGNARSLSSAFVQAMRGQEMGLGDPQQVGIGGAPLYGVEAGQVFLAPVEVGGQDFYVVVDTGSSDPWLVLPDFTCIDPSTGDATSQANCYFGTPYNSSQSSTYHAIADENFNVTYADQETLNGEMAYDSFTFGGINVPRQKFGTVDYAEWYGDGVSSGLVGFAYGTLTSAYAGTDPTKDQRGATLMYNPLFVNMYNLSLIAPVFSLAINRDPNEGGLLALGGTPNIPHSPYWASAPIQSVGFFVGTETPAYEFYTVHADGFAYSASPNAQFDVLNTGNPYKIPLTNASTVIIDSGTSLLYAPSYVAEGVAAAFNPPAVFNSGFWYVNCDAVPPTFGVSIGQKIFFVNPLDLVVPASGGQCTSGVQPNNGGLTILGDVWMKNVISVFDIGAEMMRFAAREFYALEGSSVPVTT